MTLLLLVACRPLAARPLDDPTAEARARMVREQLVPRGITDPRVLAAMERVPRHQFVPEDLRTEAYADTPLPIGHEQTISQPYIVARMTQAADVQPGDRVLEIGTGSGYQAAVLAELGARVHSIEILEPVAAFGKANLASTGYSVTLRVGDGYRGWPEAAPFDAILVTAAPDHVPQPLIDQLAVGGVLVLPVGVGDQELVRIVRQDADTLTRDVLDPVRFVPMTGEALPR